MKKQHLTIHDIARELDVSASTVSRALQNHPRISETTRMAVQKLAAKYNYQPNVVASSLRSGKSKTVGVIVPRINRNFFSNVIGGLEESLAASGYHTMICQTHERFDNEVTAIQTLINARVDAIVLSISMETKNSDHIRILMDRGIRLFFFDRFFENIETGSVAVDDRLGAYLSVRHMLDQGYRRIFHVAGADHINVYQGRKQGYLQAMNEAGIDVPDQWILKKPLIVEGGESAFLSGMKLSPGPDAFFCAGDYAALGVLQAAKSKGMRVPEDIGITGFANEPFTAYLEPSLTTVDQKGGDMGKMLATMFLQCEENSSMTLSCERKILEPELIIRKSSLLNK